MTPASEMENMLLVSVGQEFFDVFKQLFTKHGLCHYGIQRMLAHDDIDTTELRNWEAKRLKADVNFLMLKCGIGKLKAVSKKLRPRKELVDRVSKLPLSQTMLKNSKRLMEKHSIYGLDKDKISEMIAKGEATEKDVAVVQVINKLQVEVAEAEKAANKLTDELSASSYMKRKKLIAKSKLMSYKKSLSTTIDGALNGIDKKFLVTKSYKEDRPALSKFIELEESKVKVISDMDFRRALLTNSVCVDKPNIKIKDRMERELFATSKEAFDKKKEEIVQLKIYEQGVVKAKVHLDNLILAREKSEKVPVRTVKVAEKLERIEEKISAANNCYRALVDYQDDYICNTSKKAEAQAVEMMYATGNKDAVYCKEFLRAFWFAKNREKREKQSVKNKSKKWVVKPMEGSKIMTSYELSDEYVLKEQMKGSAIVLGTKAGKHKKSGCRSKVKKKVRKGNADKNKLINSLKPLEKRVLLGLVEANKYKKNNIGKVHLAGRMRTSNEDYKIDLRDCVKKLSSDLMLKEGSEEKIGVFSAEEAMAAARSMARFFDVTKI